VLRIPPGKSDHFVLIFDCKVHTSKTNHTDKRVLSKGNHDGHHASLKMDWISMLHQHDSNVEAMWQLFKSELGVKIDEYVPIANNFNPKKETWTRPLDITVRQKFSTNIVCGKATRENVIPLYLSSINLPLMQFVKTLKKL